MNIPILLLLLLNLPLWLCLWIRRRGLHRIAEGHRTASELTGATHWVLEASPPRSWSSTLTLKLDEQPWGECRSSQRCGFDRNVVIEGRSLGFHRDAAKRRYTLIDETNSCVLAEANIGADGNFYARWTLRLGDRLGQMVLVTSSSLPYPAYKTLRSCPDSYFPPFVVEEVNAAASDADEMLGSQHSQTQVLAIAMGRGSLTKGWIVYGRRSLHAEDLVFIGLLYSQKQSLRSEELTTS